MHACSCAFSYVGLMKQASERHSFLCHSCWDGMGWGGNAWRWIRDSAELWYRVPSYLVVYRKNKRERLFPWLMNGACADRIPKSMELEQMVHLEIVFIFLYVILHIHCRPQGPYIPICHQTPCYAYIHLNLLLIYPFPQYISSHKHSHQQVSAIIIHQPPFYFPPP